jgi:hypothetical protein
MLGNFIKESTATTGTGTMTLAQMSGFERYSQVFAVGALAWYVIQDGSNREIGIGTVGASNTLARTTILETLVAGTRTLNPGTGITLSGSAQVYCDIPMQYTPNSRKGADVAAGSPVNYANIWSIDGDLVDVTGSGSIWFFGTAVRAGQVKIIRMAITTTIVHNPPNITCPGGANIVTAAGDYAIVVAHTTTDARIAMYCKASGQGLINMLPLTGGTMSGPIAMGNNTISGIKNATFSEPNIGWAGSAITIDWTLGNNIHLGLDAASCAITISNPPGVGHYQLRIVQDGAGNHAVTWGGAAYSASRWLGSAAAPALNMTPGSWTFINFYYDGTQLYQSLSKVGVA